MCHDTDLHACQHMLQLMVATEPLSRHMAVV